MAGEISADYTAVVGGENAIQRQVADYSAVVGGENAIQRQVADYSAVVGGENAIQRHSKFILRDAGANSSANAHRNAPA